MRSLFYFAKEVVVRNGGPKENEAISAGDLHTIDNAWESLDYDVCENVEYCFNQSQISKSGQETARWLSFAAIGVITATFAIALSLFIEILSELKLKLITGKLVHFENLHSVTPTALPLVPGFLLWVGTGMLYAGISAAVVIFIQPTAGGSGIPQLKSYLNGIRVRAFLGFDAMIVKLVGTGLSVASGLAVGQEGPMVHIGAIIGAGVAEGTLKVPKCQQCRTNKRSPIRCCLCNEIPITKYFRNDHDKRYKK